MFFRFIYLYLLFVYEYLCFTSKNLFCRRLFGKQLVPRVELVKRITKHLENINIVYVKVFQSLCLEKDILNDDEKDYLMKYTDNVPYSNSEIDFQVLDKLEEEFGVYVENRRPVNSGIVGVVFKGKDIDNKKIVVKILKRNIKDKYDLAYDELEQLAKYLQFVPCINSIDYIKMLGDSKVNILSQCDLTNECNNIDIFYNKFKNNDEFVIPYVYKDITEKYKDLIVMTDITGMKFNDIQKYNDSVKYQFGKLLQKFGLLSILFHSCMNGDFHAGNVFFYINDTKKDETNVDETNVDETNVDETNVDETNVDETNVDEQKYKKYKLGVIDYGLCYFPSPENQNAYYTFFYDIQVKEDFSKILTVAPILIENTEYYYTFSYNKKNMFVNDVIDCIKKYSIKDIDINFFMNLSKIFKKYDLVFTKEFNNICMSIQVTNSLIKSLAKDTSGISKEIMNEFEEINKLTEIEDK